MPVGRENSGMDTRVSIFQTIIPADKIVTLNQEERFSTADVKEDTELNVVNEASTMNAHHARRVLRGCVVINLNRDCGLNWNQISILST